MSIKKINGYKIFLSEELGKGSYGAVYKGEQDKSKQACAIKIIDKKNINSDPYLKSALFSQIQILGKLNSENIVKLFDVMESSHNYYIVQELCDSDLEKFLKNHHHGAVDEEEAIKMLTHICNGFLTLVREGVVHRDMKPANILISGGAVKIADFGFAKENIHRKVKNESSVGTPMYMSVEVLKGKTYTSKCDIWAIGVIFYQMLHGKTPWKAKSQFQLVSSIIKKPIVFDPKLKQQTKDFLECTLKTYEKDRICWDDLFQHPIFDGYFHKYLDESKEFENKYKAVMGDLRFRVNAENIDIKKLWKNLGYKEEKELNFKEFQKFLNAIIPNMKKAQQSYFFEQMDANGDGNLSLHELEVQLEKFNISLTPRLDEKVQFRRTMTIKPQNGVDDSDSEQKQVEVDQQFQRKVKKCFVKLNKILENKKLTLYQTFVAYDADKSGQLTLDQFSKIMCRLDSSFTNEQLQCVFKLIDADSSNTIEFDQLNAYYCKVNCLPEVMDLPMQYREKRFAKKMTYLEKTG